MTQQSALEVKGDDVRCWGGMRCGSGAGGGKTREAEGEAGKSIQLHTFSPEWQRKGIYCGGMMIYVRGRKAVRVRRDEGVRQ